MAVNFYDEAVKAKIKNIFPNTEFQSRELSFKTITDRTGEVKFPFISIFRPDGWTISSANTWISTKEFVNDLRQVIVDLSYQIDIYANTRKDLEEVTAELVLYLLRNPGIVVHYSSADGTIGLDVKTSLVYVSGPERTSELDDETVGRPYRYTLVFSLNNAIIYNFASSDASSQGSDDYVPKVTQVIVDVIAEVDSDVRGSGSSHKTSYNDNEEVI